LLSFLREATNAVAAVYDRRNSPQQNQPAVIDRRYSFPLRELSIALVDDATIAALNQQFLNHAGPTDVISFDLGDDLGEIIVSAERAVIVARRHRLPPHAELALYLVHGLLHLAGLDDRTPAQRRSMRRAEKLVLGRLRQKVNFGP
jgi:probable rRNA maturation factor